MDSSFILEILKDVIKAAVLAAVFGAGGYLATFFFGLWRGWWDRTSLRGRWIAGAGSAVAIAAGAALTYITIFPPPAKAPGKLFAILVAKLEGDKDGSQTRHIRSSLISQFGEQSQIDVLFRDETLAMRSGNLQAEISEAEKCGQKWLKQQRADVLIWGEVGASDKVLRLRFLSQSGDGGGTKAYRLNEVLELPANFNANLDAVLAVQAATLIKPIYERSGEALANVIEPIVAKLRPLAENPPASFADKDKAKLWHAFANGEQRLGEERGRNTELETAIRYYRKVLEVSTREHVPLDWAATQNNLGTALRNLGERESSTTRLNEAVAVYREALKELTRERVPLDWAATQNNLGSALESLGEWEAGTARLDEAVAAFREALKERTRERVPLDWARTQNNLGTALLRLGERESGTARLEEAVAVYREALKELTRERVPLDWATTQNNLGTALTRLGERESGTARLEEAVAAYREALKEWTRERVPLDWAKTQHNLGSALTRLGERESGTARLEEAVAAYREALKERTRERVPLDWAGTQNNLGTALWSLGERESGTARLEEAVAAYREALKERTRERVPLRWAATQNSLGRVLTKLGEKRTEKDKLSGCRTLMEAQAALAALKEARESGISNYVRRAQINLWHVDAAIARFGC